MRNPENRIISGIDAKNKRRVVEQAQTPESLEEKYAYAKETLARSTIDPATFSDMFSAHMLSEHARLVENAQKNFSEEDHEKRGVIFEAAVLEGIQRGNMFGKDSIAFKTAPYDDIKHHVDIVLEKDGTPTGLGVDASTSAISTRNKIADIIAEVRDGKLTEIQYFQTANFKGRALNVPRVVLGVDRDAALEFDALWFDVAKGKKPLEALKHTPVRGIFIHQMLMQLKVFSAYALRTGNKTAASAYQRGLLVVQDAITAAKEDGVHVHFTNPTDRVHREILNSLSELSYAPDAHRSSHA